MGDFSLTTVASALLSADQRLLSGRISELACGMSCGAHCYPHFHHPRRGLPVFRTKKDCWTMVARGSLFFNKSRVPEKSMKGRLNGFVFRDISLVLGISPKMLPRAAVAQPFFFVPKIGNPCRDEFRARLGRGLQSHAHMTRSHRRVTTRSSVAPHRLTLS